jgi:hypothetical protein
MEVNVVASAFLDNSGWGLSPGYSLVAKYFVDSMMVFLRSISAKMGKKRNEGY